VALVEENAFDLRAALPKANVLNRFIAKFLDLLIVSAIDQIPLSISFLAALSYLLIADGLSGGKSLGKQVIGLQTWMLETGQGASFKESIIRNFPLGIAYGMAQIPYIGWLLGTLVLAFESLLLIGNPRGGRIGDDLAKTQVIDLNAFEGLEK